MVTNLTQEDLDQWKKHPVTIEVMDVIQRIRDMHVDALATGGTFDADSMEVTFGNTAKVVGMIEGIDVFLNLRIDEEEHDEL